MRVKFVEEAATEFLDALSYYEQQQLQLDAASKRKSSRHCIG